MNKSYLKWQGSKYRCLPHILDAIGDCSDKIFVEPFVGSATVALNVQAKHKILNDLNWKLISCHKDAYNIPEFVIESTTTAFNLNDEVNYYHIRRMYNDAYADAGLIHFTDAGDFIYLNRHCFNGLYRENKKGEFNVPYGRYKSPYLPEAEIRSFKDNIGPSVEWASSDFNLFLNSFIPTASAVIFSGGGLLADIMFYIDPPYIPASATLSNVKYTYQGFSFEQQKELASLAGRLASHGAKVVVSNHDLEITRELYKSADEIRSIDVRRSGSCKTSSRGNVKELIAIWN